GTLKEWDLRPTGMEPIASVEETDGLFFSRNVTVSSDGAWVARAGYNSTERLLFVEVWHATGRGPAVCKAPLPPGEPATLSEYVPLLSRDGKRVALVRPVLTQNPLGNNPETAGQVVPRDLTVWDVASGNELFHTVLGTDINNFFFSQCA